MIEVEYNSNKNNLIDIDFRNMSTGWTILTGLDILILKIKWLNNKI